jgi:hypothetical protein
MQGFFRRLARSPAAPIAALGVLLSVTTIVLFVTDLETRYRDRIETTKKDAQSFAKILAEHAALTLEDVDRALLEAEAIRKNSLSGRFADPGAVSTALRQLQKSSPVLVAIGWTDASGQVLAHSYPDALPRSNISGMAHFVAQRDGAADRLYVSPPYLSAAGDGSPRHRGG